MNVPAMTQLVPAYESFLSHCDRAHAGKFDPLCFECRERQNDYAELRMLAEGKTEPVYATDADEQREYLAKLANWDAESGYVRGVTVRNVIAAAAARYGHFGPPATDA